MKPVALVMLLACTTLVGCGQSRILLGPVGVVKGYTYDPDNNNNVPIGKALDNRQMCSDVGWRVGKTDSGREIVTYVCRLTGYKDLLVNHRVPDKLEQRIAFSTKGKTAMPVYCDFAYKFPGMPEKVVRNESCFNMAYDSQYNNNWKGLWDYLGRDQ